MTSMSVMPASFSLLRSMVAPMAEEPMPASQAKTIFFTDLMSTLAPVGAAAETAWPLEAALEAATWAWASARLASLPKNFSRNTEMAKLTAPATAIPAILAK